MFFLFAFSTVLATHVNVMLPLNTVSINGQLDESVSQAFSTLKSAGVYGVMVDVWWGIAEPNPTQYNFAPYVRLADICAQYGLKLQCVMSFHRCGGNVGDDCNIPIPSWVRNANGIFYKDQWGWEDTEIVALDADELAVLQGRTPIQCYTDFMNAFKSAMGSRMGAIVNEVQVGVGPCGELRYPGYQMDRWSFPGVGAFQAFSNNMLSSFRNASAAAGHPEWNSPPTDAGGYNSKPDETNFFKNGGGFQTEFGRFFTNWYATELLNHGRRVLSSAVQIFKPVGCEVAMKISGIHWWYKHSSHAAELTTGYPNGNGASGGDFYTRASALCKELGVILDFTCFEMLNSEQSSSFGCAPEDLVYQVLMAARNAGIALSAENALPRYDAQAYNTIINNACNKGGKVEALTYLRLTETLWKNSGNLNEFKRLVSSLSHC